MAARSGRAAAGAGVDGPVVAVAVRLACGGPAGAGDAAAAAGGRQAARPLAPSGSPAGDCLAALEAVTAGLRERFPALAAVSAHEVAAHLSGGLWLAPPVPVLEFNTSLFHTAAVSPS